MKRWTTETIGCSLWTSYQVRINCDVINFFLMDLRINASANIRMLDTVVKLWIAMLAGCVSIDFCPYLHGSQYIGVAGWEFSWSCLPQYSFLALLISFDNYISGIIQRKNSQLFCKTMVSLKAAIIVDMMVNMNENHWSCHAVTSGLMLKLSSVLLNNIFVFVSKRCIQSFLQLYWFFYRLILLLFIL